MEYLESEKREIKYYWDNYYIQACNLCNHTGYIDNQMCNCIKKANASYLCEINGFGREYLKRNLHPGKLRDDIYNYFVNNINSNMFLFGPHSKGKTIAVTSLAKQLIIKNNPLLTNNYNIKFFLYDDLVRSIFDNNIFSQKLEPIIKKTDILVLDNIGSEYGLKTNTQFSVSLLENILRNREITGKLTWITSNLTFKDMKSSYSESIYYIIKRGFMILAVL